MLHYVQAWPTCSPASSPRPCWAPR